MAAVPPQRGGMAAGAVNTARQLGFAFGIAALGSVFTSSAASVLADRGVPSSNRVAQALSGGQARYLLKAVPSQSRGQLDSALHASSVHGVQWVFIISGITGVVAALAVFVLMRPARVTVTEPEPVAVAA
jgi:hypothetical protein